MEANQTKIYELRGGKPALASTHDYLPGSPDILLISEKKLGYQEILNHFGLTRADVKESAVHAVTVEGKADSPECYMYYIEKL